MYGRAEREKIDRCNAKLEFSPPEMITACIGLSVDTDSIVFPGSVDFHQVRYTLECLRYLTTEGSPAPLLCVCVCVATDRAEFESYGPGGLCFLSALRVPETHRNCRWVRIAAIPQLIELLALHRSLIQKYVGIFLYKVLVH
ncbi:hypothetical protein BaRGS_00026058 [Batillaria attramentaria]|uniref:Uncharacterized protein n=1 Tax=Batillaria attramentaria TaxID=370345 RepID=A0ABD0K7C5_9CAEN